MDCQFVMALCTYVHYQTFILPRITDVVKIGSWDQIASDIVVATFASLSDDQKANAMSRLTKIMGN